MESFGGKKPYLSDFEIADDLTPDPFSEEPVQTLRHARRESLRAENLKKKRSFINQYHIRLKDDAGSQEA